jgi:hypothetical protein
MSAALIGVLAAAALFALFGVQARVRDATQERVCDAGATGGCGACGLVTQGGCALSRSQDADGESGRKAGSAERSHA